MKTEGLADAEIRKAVVAAKLGDAAIAGKPEAYIDARFDILVEDAKKAAGSDPFANVVKDGIKPNVTLTADEDKAWAASIADLNRKTEAA